MVDFLMISTRPTKKGTLEIYPKFKMYPKSKDLMIRGGDFYAVWMEDEGLWSTDEEDALQIIDRELDKFAKENQDKFNCNIRVLHMWDSETGMVDSWHKYCQKQKRDSFHMLDEKLIFSNTETKKEDYASKRLDYPLEPGDTSAYEKLISTLYTEEERYKIEWAIGSIVTGDSKTIQKFLVLYGEAGTGKSTILNIIQKLFNGYCSTFDAKAIGSASNMFALEAFKTNPLVAIQHDGDLSRIEDNTRLNSLVSHELMTVNEKFKSAFTNSFKAFLFMGTNKPVKITDGKSGLIRRLIDVKPSGNKLSSKAYKEAFSKIDFELGAIAYHCKEVYLENPGRYDNYIPTAMLGASNDFYNFVLDSYHIFKKENGTTLKAAWEMYKTYCDEAKVPFPFSKRNFKEELKNYFHDFNERFNMEDGSRVRSYYKGFRTEKFENDKKQNTEPEHKPEHWLKFDSTESIFDDVCSDCPAQYASVKETPTNKWEKVTTQLKDIDTSKLHYVQIPENHIVIDFDIKDETGKKSFEKNVEAASKWPSTYAETSKSGAGIHLHYIYTGGDPKELSRIYDTDVEIKVFTGKSSLRRLLTKCNNLPISTISSGLPKKKGRRKMVEDKVIKSERSLREQIKRNLNKEIHPGTKPSIDFIYEILEGAYNSGLHYDVSDMFNPIFAFAAQSTHKADYCIDLVSKMKFKSENASLATIDEEKPIVFYDIEVFPNLFLVNWKLQGKEKPIIRMINPRPSDIEELLQFNLIGFNCRRYDNHLIYARLMGYSNEQLYNLSQKIINNSDDNVFFREAYNLSYTDVYDFASAGNKKSLKKFEIQLGIHHQELGLPWDEPVPEDKWTLVAEYCDNDVIATEAVFNHLSGDWTARQILADLAGMTVNDTTNTLTTRFIFGMNRHPQDQFCYRDLSQPVYDLSEDVRDFLQEACPKMMRMTHGEAGSLLPYFPGYKYENGVSTYRGVKVGEGGLAEGIPGIYYNAALLDIASMHPHSTIAECLFGPVFTRRFREIVEGRVSIKHEAWEEVNGMLDGKLTPYIEKVKNGEMTAKELANALKTAINSVYGLTAARFPNAFNDKRNKDNIVAKRGALFMVDLKYAVEERGFTVAHIKTDSIKIPNATPEIIQFVMDFGEQYGYTFEHEATYDRMCLVNDSVYIANFATAEKCQELYGYVPDDNKKKSGKWSATGTQFQIPYVFKTLFSKEIVEFNDLCTTFSVSKGDLYLDINEKLPDVTDYEKQLEKLEKSYKQGKISDTMFEPESQELADKIAEGHDLHFVGRVGQFTPVNPGHGGGVLYRVNDGKNYSASGTKGYRWMESEMLRGVNTKDIEVDGKMITVLDDKDDLVDMSYHNKMVDDAIETISKYGDFEMFVSQEAPMLQPVNFMTIPDGIPETVPFA